MRDLGLGVEGAAAASVLAQAVSALMSFLYIKLRMPALVPVSWTRVSAPLLRRTLWFGAVSGVQQTVLYFGILILQGAVNPLGITQIAAFNAVSRVDGFVMALSDSFASSLMMVRLAEQKARARNGAYFSACGARSRCAPAETALCAVALFLFPRRARLGLPRSGRRGGLVARRHVPARNVRPLHDFGNLQHVQGFFRGVGMMKTVLYATYIQIPVRVGVTYALARSAGINAAAAGITAGWLCMAAYQLFEYHKFVNSWRAARPEKGR